MFCVRSGEQAKKEPVAENEFNPGASVCQKQQAETEGGWGKESWLAWHLLYEKYFSE